MTPLAMRIMDGSASAAEQAHYAQRLITVGERLRRRAERISGKQIVPAELEEQTIRLVKTRRLVSDGSESLGGLVMEVPILT